MILKKHPYIQYALVAQSEERATVNREVGGSKPPEGVYTSTRVWSNGRGLRSRASASWVQIPPRVFIIFPCRFATSRTFRIFTCFFVR